MRKDIQKCVYDYLCRLACMNDKEIIYEAYKEYGLDYDDAKNIRRDILIDYCMGHYVNNLYHEKFKDYLHDENDEMWGPFGF